MGEASREAWSASCLHARGAEMGARSHFGGIIGTYLVFVAPILGLANATSFDPRISVAPAVVIVAASAIWIAISSDVAQAGGVPGRHPQGNPVERSHA